MEWIDVKTKLPNVHEEVLVWVKYESDPEFTWSDAWLENQENEAKYTHSYKEPISQKYWAMGSAENYVITHWMRIKAPKK